VIGEILWPIAVAFAAHRLAMAVERFAPKREESPKSTFPTVSEVPDDLLAVAAQENEVWAQEEVIRVIRERYEELQDWNRVRRAMGIGVMSDG